MKRTLQFNNTDTGYACFDNGEIVFEISRTDLQFDVKAFYQAFYSEDKDYEDIEVENCIPDDKNARRVYECIIQLMTKIKEKLAEMPADSDENTEAQQIETIMVGKYKVITLCGSTRFKDEFMEVQKRLTLEGNIVISVGLFGHSGDNEVWEDMDDDILAQGRKTVDEIAEGFKAQTYQG